MEGKCPWHCFFEEVLPQLSVSLSRPDAILRMPWVGGKCRVFFLAPRARIPAPFCAEGARILFTYFTHHLLAHFQNAQSHRFPAWTRIRPRSARKKIDSVLPQLSCVDAHTATVCAKKNRLRTSTGFLRGCAYGRGLREEEEQPFQRSVPLARQSLHRPGLSRASCSEILYKQCFVGEKNALRLGGGKVQGRICPWVGGKCKVGWLGASPSRATCPAPGWGESAR